MKVSITRIQMEIHRVVHLCNYLISRGGFIWRNKDSGIRFSQRRFLCGDNNMETVESSLISIFTKSPIFLESPLLHRLSSKLTPKVVEAVLKSVRHWKSAVSFFDWASRQNGYSHNCYAYNAMAAVLSNARQKATLKVLSENVLNSKCYWPPGAFGYFLRCLGSQALIEEANHLFDQVRIHGLCNLNSYSYTCLMEVIAKGSNVSLLEYRLNETKSFGWPIDKYVLTPALQCYCNAGMFDKAFRIFNELAEKGCVDQHILSILVLSYSKCGNIDKAFTMIEWSEENLNIYLNEKTFCILIHGSCRMCRVDKALELYYKMKKHGYEPDISVYDVLIRGFCMRNEIGTALELLKNMKRSGIFPDIQIMKQLISCMHDDKEIFKLLEDTLKDLDAEKKMLLCSSMVKALIKDCHVEKAYRVVKLTFGSDMISKNTNFSIQNVGSSCFEIVIDALCMNNLYDMALELFRDMRTKSWKRSISLFNGIISSLSSADRLTECFDLLNEIKETELQPTHFTFNCILGCLCRKGDASGSLTLIREMRIHGYEPWIKNYTALVKKLCKNERSLEASNFLYEMSREGFLPDLIAYSVVIDGFLVDNELDHGLKLFTDIRERGYNPDVVSYNTIIKGLCKAKRITEAEKIVNEICVNGLIPSIVTYNSLIDGWCKDGDINQAVEWFYKMRKEGQEPNVITYTTLIDGFCNAGKSDEALHFWNEMESKRCDANRIAYMSLINGLCKCQKPDDALLYLKMMEEKGMVPDLYIYTALIHCFSLHSNAALVIELQQKMTTLCPA